MAPGHSFFVCLSNLIIKRIFFQMFARRLPWTFVHSLRESSVSGFDWSTVPGFLPYPRANVFLCSHLWCPQVHCSLHLAVNQLYLRRLGHMEKERRGYDLYGAVQRNSRTLCSPYPANTSDVCWRRFFFFSLAAAASWWPARLSGFVYLDYLVNWFPSLFWSFHYISFPVFISGVVKYRES